MPKKGKNLLFLKFPCTPGTNELKWINDLHDCIDVTSFIGKLPPVAYDISGSDDAVCVPEAAVKGACCCKERKGSESP